MRYRVKGPDGQVHVFDGPDGATPAEVEAFAAQTFTSQVKQQTAPESSMAADAIGGSIRGPGSIGETLLTPIDAGARALGIENSFIGRSDRGKAMDDGLRELIGADPNSATFKGFKLGTEVLGTLGVGGWLAKGAKALGAAPELVNSLGSAGFTTGAQVAPGFIGGATNALTRAAGGAATGGASTAAVDPENALTGALIGGALPGVLKVAGTGANALGRLFSGEVSPTVQAN